ncbi:MAG: glycoside hydrolase family 3 N-terminal domain-containing protein [Bacteroidales bacterium]|nr:glycoside hydrolase family 3 N-terminal domain-containing protein [Bacteroidales bacterium]
MKRNLLFTAVAFLIFGFSTRAQIPSDAELRRYAAQMLMVGFKGNTVDDQSDAARYIRDLKVGSIVLFDIDLTGTAKIGSRNITSREQLAKLTADLQSFADYPLLIAADQEGGLVQRLKPAYGYEKLPNAEYLGNIDNRDTTRFYARLMATQLATSGVNLNLAPVLDVLNPECPPIGKIQRSFGTDANVIVRHASIQIDEMHRQHVLNAVKHFPGHGNALGDSHWGFVDVTATWQPSELEPFRRLIKKGKVDVVMTAHIINGNIDPDYPATLSRKTIDGVLRKQLGYDGVVVSDDMYMEGIIKKYDIENALVLAINAGCDLLCVGNNINTGFEADRPFRLVDLIVKNVKNGRIPWGRLVQSHKRIEKLYKKLRK